MRIGLMNKSKITKESFDIENIDDETLQHLPGIYQKFLLIFKRARKEEISENRKLMKGNRNN